MRFADEMVVRGNSEDSCRDFVYRAAERLHRLGLNINVAKVRYVSKPKFNQYWGFEVMDRFESGGLFKALTSQELTTLRRNGGRIGCRETALVPLHLSREQLLSFIRLYDGTTVAMQHLVPLFLEQPFSQPKAIFLRVLKDLRVGHQTRYWKSVRLRSAEFGSCTIQSLIYVRLRAPDRAREFKPVTRSVWTPLVPADYLVIRPARALPSAVPGRFHSFLE